MAKDEKNSSGYEEEEIGNEQRAMKWNRKKGKRERNGDRLKAGERTFWKVKVGKREKWRRKNNIKGMVGREKEKKKKNRERRKEVQGNNMKTVGTKGRD